MQPLFYKHEDCIKGPRIGGSLPAGLEGHIKNKHAQYFGTFPLPGRPDREFSIFHSFDILGNNEEHDIIAYNNRVLEPSELIWAAVHAVSSRGELSNQPFESRALEIGPESVDGWTDEEGHEISYPMSKLGGKCFLERYWLQAHVTNLENDSYAQVLQICMHGNDLIDGFPWDPGCLHMWALNPDDPNTYRFMVEQ